MYATEKPLSWKEIQGQQILVVGLGGGADIISAYAVAKAIESPECKIVYGNTKRVAESDLTQITEHIFEVGKSLSVPNDLSDAFGTTKVDRIVPRCQGCPLIFKLLEDKKPLLADEIKKYNFDRIIGVDTGGDILQTKKEGEKRGLDHHMLEVLLATEIPVSLVVVGLGSDGETSRDDLQKIIENSEGNGSLQGKLDFAPIKQYLEQFREQLPEYRTTNLILQANDCSETEMLVPRDLRPMIPTSWLLSALLFDPKKF
ncbi:DUF1152 domain-containing protein [Candidatus Uabimicrobium sp. HlEnr_7]|uniref:DUF1152 domain-containing protein n=1 Tax=Candidatus Uabimicrobium helgolandensis TaxID=3095367 RepID=UPI003556F41A